MAVVEKAIDVEAPVTRIYEQWIRFQEFPRFAQGVKEVRGLDRRRSRWRVVIAGREKMWEAQITRQIPNQRICWRTTGRMSSAGIANFYSLDARRSRIIVWIKFVPRGVVEHIGNLCGIVARKVVWDLRRFKEFVESTGLKVDAHTTASDHRRVLDSNKDRWS